MPKTIPISKYVPKKFGKIVVKNLPVFKLEAVPKSSPIDLNVSALSEESGWSLSDRLRFWHTLNGTSTLPAIRLTIRKLDLEEQALVLCHVEADGTLTILSNSKDCATRFFNSVFLDIPPSFPVRRDWRLKGGWVNDKSCSILRGDGCGSVGLGTESAARDRRLDEGGPSWDRETELEILRGYVPQSAASPDGSCLREVLWGEARKGIGLERHHSEF
jgi:hypothetical protein